MLCLVVPTLLVSCASGSSIGAGELLSIHELAIQSPYLTHRFLAATLQLNTDSTAVARAGIAAFAGTLNGLVTANPPTPELGREVTNLASSWAIYRQLLEGSLGSIGSAAQSLLVQVEAQQRDVSIRLDRLWRKYEAFMQLSDMQLPPMVQRTAETQLIRIEQILLAAFFVGTGVSSSRYLAELVSLQHAFNDAHDTIKHGNRLVGVPELSEVCPMRAMFNVSRAWEQLRGPIEAIERAGAATQELLLATESSATAARAAMAEALAFLSASGGGTCDAAQSLSDLEWTNGMLEVAKFRSSEEKAARFCFQIAKGYGTPELELALSRMLEETTALLVSSIEGSLAKAVPSPPFDAILIQLVDARDHWRKFSDVVKRGKCARQDVPLLANLSSYLFEELGRAEELYGLGALAAGTSLPITTWELSQRQLGLLDQMVKNAFLVSLGFEPHLRRAELEATAGLFKVSHRELVAGRPDTQAPPPRVLHDEAVQRTVDACTLNAMAAVLLPFNQLYAGLQALADDPENSTGAVMPMRQVEALVTTAAKAMTTAVGYYAGTSSGACDMVASVAAWEAGLQWSGHFSYLILQARTEYTLVSSGLSDFWSDQAEAAFADQIRFLEQEAASPSLVDAFKAFERAWISFRGTDADRRLALQVAYITLNPNPLGSKEVLDYAPGPEEYHAVHRKYHPIYRTILYNRNFYDVFMFDLSGNLIYSVYKELDYATNFELDRDGQWKTSGLGDAYRAGKANPDRTTVIDWKPYGPSAGALASFVSTGVKDASGLLVGVFAIQLPPAAKPTYSRQILRSTVTMIDGALDPVRFGDANSLPSPPSQVIADQMLAMGDAWIRLKPLLSGSYSTQVLPSLVAHTEACIAASGELLRSFVEGAWASARELEGTKIAVMGQQLALAERMRGEVALLNAGGVGARSKLQASIAAFQRDQLLVTLGNSSGRRAVGDVVPVTYKWFSPLQMAADASWLQLQPTLTTVANGGATSEPVVKTVQEEVAPLVKPLDEAFMTFTTLTRSTTSPPLQILAPIPLTGDWTAGRTMRAAALLAEKLINEEQRILPGYELKTVFFDDKCDSTTASRILLGEMSQRSDYVALGGTGCSKVCEALAFTASTLRMPLLSYDCSASSLSDTESYPDFVRFGTPTTAGAIDVVRKLGTERSWSHITVISAGEAEHQAHAQQMSGAFTGLGFTSNWVSADNARWQTIMTMMTQLKESTKGQHRVFFVVGHEEYFRKLLCASILTGARQGITWISEGAWRDRWWGKSNALAQFHRDWLLEDTHGAQLRKALEEFTQAWNELGSMGSVARVSFMQSRYVTEQKERLESVTGPEFMHEVHRRWHKLYRDTLHSRDYYDIFIFNLNGDLIYSVFKELDYATNFAAEGNGPWKDSGLGDAYRAGLADPTNISYVDWRPYGPSKGAPAAFLSTGIHDHNEVLKGVYAIQLPPSYHRSIETVHPECTLQAMASAYEGAVNVVGLGRPTDESMEKPLACFGAHSASSFMSLLDTHLKEGLPSGNVATMVKDPYHDIKANAADATCVAAFMVQHLLAHGRGIEEVKNPTLAVYAEMLSYVRTQMDFQGASGRVRFQGNDRPSPLVVQQVQQGSHVEVGLVTVNGTASWTNGGPIANAWTKEHEDPPTYFPWIVLHITIPTLICLAPTLLALRAARNWDVARRRRMPEGRGSGNERKQGGAKQAKKAQVTDGTDSVGSGPMV